MVQINTSIIYGTSTRRLTTKNINLLIVSHQQPLLRKMIRLLQRILRHVYSHMPQYVDVCIVCAFTLQRDGTTAELLTEGEFDICFSP